MFKIKQSPDALLQRHFAPTPLDQVAITERTFPMRVRADLQRAMDRLPGEDVELIHFCGVRKRYDQGMSFAELLVPDEKDPVTLVPPQYEEVSVGDGSPVRCATQGLWLFRCGGTPCGVLLEPATHYTRHTNTLRYQVSAPNSEAGTKAAQRLLAALDQAVADSACYRGKILSLELDHHYSGVSSGISVHKLHTVPREQVSFRKARWNCWSGT